MGLREENEKIRCPNCTFLLLPLVCFHLQQLVFSGAVVPTCSFYTWDGAVFLFPIADFGVTMRMKILTVNAHTAMRQ